MPAYPAALQLHQHPGAAPLRLLHGGHPLHLLHQCRPLKCISAEVSKLLTDHTLRPLKVSSTLGTQLMSFRLAFSFVRQSVQWSRVWKDVEL